MADPYAGIRRHAREVRASLGRAYVAAPAHDVLDALARRREITIDYLDPDHPLLRGARAAWRAEFGLVVVDRTLPDAERLFAIAHELGHSICHRTPPDEALSFGYGCESGDIDETASADASVWGYSPREAREVEANIFAAELLAPSFALRARFLAGATYRDLAALYGVTPSCILNSLVRAVLERSDEDDEGEASPPAPVAPISLDTSQRRAARTDRRHVLVDAGPGTGKTRTLIARVHHLLHSGRAGPQHILVLTFSRRAAEELRERLRDDPAASAVAVATFHGFARDVLRRFAPQAGLNGDVRVVDETDAAMLLEELLPALDLEQYAHLVRPTLYLPSLLAACSRMRDDLLTLDDVRASVDAACGEEPDETRCAALRETLRLIEAYEGALETHGLVDYGGLIARAIHLLRADPAVAAAVRGGLRHIMVDEYQDVNRACAVLLRELGRDGAHLWVVGDARQAIYRFRGAAPANITAFEEDYPDAVRLSLDVNYRALPALVRLANAAAQTVTGPPASWRAHRTGGSDEGVTVACAPDDVSEQDGVVADIQRSLAAGHRAEDHAILCRTHRQAAEMAAAVRRAGLPASYLGSLFGRPEIKDLLALLDLCCGSDGAALLRLATWPEYGIGADRVASLIRAAGRYGLPFPSALRDERVLDGLSGDERAAMERLSAHVEAVRYYPDPAQVLLRFLFGDAPYLRRLLQDAGVEGYQAAAAIGQLVVLARRFMTRPVTGTDPHAVRAFLRYVRGMLARGDETMAQAPLPGAVHILTVHACKGLEFPIVYVPNLAAQRFPPRWRGGAQVALPPLLERVREDREEDERSLFFVALSRAEDRLILSRAACYRGRPHKESPLLADLRRVYPLDDVTWPASDEPATEAPAPFVPSALPVTVGAGEVEAMIRCPAQHHYRYRLGLRDDTLPGYRTFARLLHGCIERLRATHGTECWPRSLEAADAHFAACWDEAIPAADPLARWYRDKARRAYLRVYHDIAQHGLTPEAQYDVAYEIDLDGARVRVQVDAIEDGDDGRHLVLERAAKRSDDADSLVVGFYGAVARTLDPASPLPVRVRYLDSGEAQDIAEPERVLAKQRERIRDAVRLLSARAAYPDPRDGQECARCPFVFICPRTGL